MDHYTVLGVNREATPDEIKKAYRKLASQHHPDKGGDTAKFQQIEEAYRILSDPNTRAQYDNPTPNHFSSNTPYGHGGFPEEIFAQMFGFNNNPFHQQRNHKPLFRTQISVSLENAYTGSSQILNLNFPTGQKVITIDIPKGVKDGFQLRYDNIIDQASLIVEFRLLPHPKFERRNDDLYVVQPISVLDLIVGTTIVFNSISGTEFEVTVAPKTQPNTQLRITGQGMPKYGMSGYGDQILLLKPYLPDIIDDEIVKSIVRSKTSTS